jgi:hypothetical protein
MTWRFQRRIGIAPGLRLNVSKSGVSASVGERGAHLTIGRVPRSRSACRVLACHGLRRCHAVAAGAVGHRPSFRRSPCCSASRSASPFWR